MTKISTCKYHCRPCGRHFTSLVGFDAHRENFQCIDASNIASLRQIQGECRINDPENVQANVTLYQLDTADDLKEYYEKRNRTSTKS
jgi:hypothetical protein